MFIITFISLVTIVLYNKAVGNSKEVKTTVEKVTNPIQSQNQGGKSTNSVSIKRKK